MQMDREPQLRAGPLLRDYFDKRGYPVSRRVIAGRAYKGGAGRSNPSAATLPIPVPVHTEEASYARGGFGAIPASRMAILGLQEPRVADTGHAQCVVCLQDF